MNPMISVKSVFPCHPDLLALPKVLFYIGNQSRGSKKGNQSRFIRKAITSCYLLRADPSGRLLPNPLHHHGRDVYFTSKLICVDWFPFFDFRTSHTFHPLTFGANLISMQIGLRLDLCHRPSTPSPVATSSRSHVKNYYAASHLLSSMHARVKSIVVGDHGRGRWMRQGGGIPPSPLAHLAPHCRLGGHRFVRRHGNGINICSRLRRQPLPALTALAALIASAT
jgi:hypothetical protein